MYNNELKSSKGICMQICLFGFCIPLDVMVPAILGWLYYIGVDFRRLLPASWMGNGQKRKEEGQTEFETKTEIKLDCALDTTSAMKESEYVAQQGRCRGKR
jgi:hypothetical protein